MKKRGCTFVEIILAIIMLVTIAIIVLCIVGIIANESNKINQGKVVDKHYSAGYTTFNYYEKQCYPVYHPEKFSLTIEGEKGDDIVQYTFDVPESEYVLYDIGDTYPHE